MQTTNHTSIFSNSSLSDESNNERPRVLCISANEKDSLEILTRRIAHFLETQADHKMFLDAIYTLNQRRSLLSYRVAIQGTSKESFVKQLSNVHSNPNRVSKRPKIGFLFTGQGAQWATMGSQLMRSYPAFSDTLREAERYISQLGAKWSLCGQFAFLDPILRRYYD